MRMRTLISLTCVIFSSKGDTLGGVDEKQDCVESCKEDRQQERLGDHCYYWSTARRSWKGSELYCQSRDGHLAAVTSLEIHNFLMKKVDKDENGRDTWFWIGGSDKEQEGNWEWTDGSVWNFPHWADQPYPWKQPSGTGFDHDCLQIYNHGYAQNGWNDQSCSLKYRFICSWRICPGSIFHLALRTNTSIYLHCSLKELFSAATTLQPNTTETVSDTTDSSDGKNIKISLYVVDK